MDLPILQMPAFPHIKLAILVNTPTLLLLFGFFIIFYASVSSVLIYHWHSYGMKSPGILFAETIYLFVSLVLFVISGISLYYF